MRSATGYGLRPSKCFLGHTSSSAPQCSVGTSGELTDTGADLRRTQQPWKARSQKLQKPACGIGERILSPAQVWIARVDCATHGRLIVWPLGPCSGASGRRLVCARHRPAHAAPCAGTENDTARACVPRLTLVISGMWVRPQTPAVCSPSQCAENARPSPGWRTKEGLLVWGPSGMARLGQAKHTLNPSKPRCSSETGGGHLCSGPVLVLAARIFRAGCRGAMATVAPRAPTPARAV